MRMHGKVMTLAAVAGMALGLGLAPAPGWAGAEEDANNSRAAELYRQDQAERHAIMDTGTQGWSKQQTNELRTNDARRREEMLDLLRAGGLHTSRDFLHAAMIFQHGTNAADYRLAHGLAVVSAALNPDNRLAQWMVAASWDRYMRHRGRPQWYGTQYTLSDSGQKTLAPMDESAVSDEERSQHGISALQELRNPPEADGTLSGEQ